MKIDKKYKILLKDNTVYTATIKDINEHFITFIDKNNIERGVNKKLILTYRELKGDSK